MAPWLIDSLLAKDNNNYLLLVGRED